eukprot:CAMPEP_0194584832 /NCGR_PEP_ID=MMETSP0292-20121207/17317_1 /TAXON_ID=39354 /ORGANISM="Heterosigma akashiwo, Strain CCMP2393" /LENGTH=360 /DNA_ID=CAMNT_0039440015 /DNA_START=293 /DNA_END=1376 /DNA_ORIENTATION=+
MFTIVSLKRMLTHDITAAMHEFPRNALITVAALDLVQLTATVMSAAQTKPVMTVILLQSIKAFSILASCAAGRAQKYSRGHLVGLLLVCAAMGLAVFPAAYQIVAPEVDEPPAAWNVLVYFLAGVPAAASGLVKERALVKFARPMDPYYLNLWVALYQFLFVLLAAPLSYKFQSLGHDWEFYPQASFAGALNDGWACAFWGEPRNGASDALPQRAQCAYSFYLAAGYVAAAVLVNVFVDRLLLYSTERAMYRGVTASILVACAALALYTTQSNGVYYPDSLSLLDVVSIIMLVIGLEVYHSVKEPDSDFLTQWTSGQPSLFQGEEAESAEEGDGRRMTLEAEEMDTVFFQVITGSSSSFD